MENSWVGIRVRKGDREGVVVNEANNFMRRLSVKFDDGGKNETIVMNNIGEDPEEVHEWEWFCVTSQYSKWYKFQ